LELSKRAFLVFVTLFF